MPTRPATIRLRLLARSTTTPAMGETSAIVPPWTKPISPTALRLSVSERTSHCIARKSTWKQTNCSRFEDQSRA